MAVSVNCVAELGAAVPFVLETNEMQDGFACLVVSGFPFRSQWWALFSAGGRKFVNLMGSNFDVSESTAALERGLLSWSVRLTDALGRELRFSVFPVPQFSLRELLDRQITGGDPLGDSFFPVYLIDWINDRSAKNEGLKKVPGSN